MLQRPLEHIPGRSSRSMHVLPHISPPSRIRRLFCGLVVCCLTPCCELCLVFTSLDFSLGDSNTHTQRIRNVNVRVSNAFVSLWWASKMLTKHTPFPSIFATFNYTHLPAHAHTHTQFTLFNCLFPNILDFHLFSFPVGNVYEYVLLYDIYVPAHTNRWQ